MENHDLLPIHVGREGKLKSRERKGMIGKNKKEDTMRRKGKERTEGRR